MLIEVTQELDQKAEKKGEVVEVAGQKRAELQRMQQECEAKKAQIVYDDPLEVENEVECATVAKG